jgi:cytochrome c556
MPAPKLEDRNLDRRCTAKSQRNGRRCGAYALRGGTVCRVHGGSAPVIKATAEARYQARLEKAVDPAIDRLQKIVTSDESADGDAVRAAEAILNRSANVRSPKSEVAIEQTGDPRELARVFAETVEAEMAKVHIRRAPRARVIEAVAIEAANG